MQEGVGHHFSLFSLYIFPKASLPLPSSQPKPCHTHRAAGGHTSSVPPYPQSWIQVESSVEQLIIIIILVLPLADNLVDGGSKANESCGCRRGADSMTPWAHETVSTPSLAPRHL